MEWFNPHQTKVERAQLVDVLVTKTSVTKEQKRELRRLVKTDHDGSFHVCLDGSVVPFFKVREKTGFEEVKAPERWTQGKLFQINRPWEGYGTANEPRKAKSAGPIETKDRNELAKEHKRRVVQRAIFFKMQENPETGSVTGMADADALLKKRADQIRRMNAPATE